MTVRSCRDCANYEERRDIDGTSLCAKRSGPYVCCEEFRLKDQTLNDEKVSNRFCVECANFEFFGKVASCSKKHSPGAGCDQFRKKTDKLDTTRQNNRLKSVAIAYAVKEKSDREEPSSLATVTRQKKQVVRRQTASL